MPKLASPSLKRPALKRPALKGPALKRPSLKRPGSAAGGARKSGSSRNSGRATIGLEIEPGHITAVEAVRDSGGVRVRRAASAPLDSGVVRDGEVGDPAALSEALSKLFTEHKLSKRVRIGVANQRIVVRTMDMPPLDNAKELAAAVQFQAQDHIPMPLDQAVLEHQAVGLVDTPEGQRSRVIVVAARRDMIDRLLEATRAAGLRPEGIDLSAFAMIRALCAGGEPVEPGSAVLYLSVGGMTNLALAEGRSCLFTRAVAGGTDLATQELAERRGLTLEHADQWLRHVGLAEPLELLEGDPAIVTEARDVLDEAVRRIADDVRNSLDFLAMQGSPVPVARAVVTGPAAMIPGFPERLSEQIAVPVTAGAVGEATPGALGGVDPARAAVAAGLAVEDV